MNLINTLWNVREKAMEKSYKRDTLSHSHVQYDEQNESILDRVRKKTKNFLLRRRREERKKKKQPTNEQQI